ncbi:MAG TPA: spore coat protein U domain-containing protein [Usitatibacter sp.]|nr:spore coat protein U domain-containing protein [Usitatibacter sp.]
MNKRLALAAAAATLFAGLSTAQAASVTGNFNVTVNLTSACQISSGPANVAFTYTSFQAAAATSTGGGFSVQCTNTLPYTMSLDATSGTVTGLNYTLALSATTGTGNGAAQSYSVNGTMASGQAGTCALASCAGSQARVLTITY